MRRKYTPFQVTVLSYSEFNTEPIRYDGRDKGTDGTDLILHHTCVYQMYEYEKYECISYMYKWISNGSWETNYISHIEEFLTVR